MEEISCAKVFATFLGAFLGTFVGTFAYRFFKDKRSGHASSRRLN